MYKPHEARIHGQVFDTLSRPLLSRSSEADESRSDGDASSHAMSPKSSPTIMGSSGTAHISWNHFGQKFHIHFSPAEVADERSDLLELLNRKVRALIPEFRGNLAYRDPFGHEILLNENGQLRELLAQRRGHRLKLFTSLTGQIPSHLGASEMGASRQSVVDSPMSTSPLLDRATRPPRAESEPMFVQKAYDDVRRPSEEATEKSEKKKKKKKSNGDSKQPSTLHPFFPPLQSGHVAVVHPSGAYFDPATQQAYVPVTLQGHPLGEGGQQYLQQAPLFIRGSWIGPNKFWGGGSWGGGGGLWGGIGPIPSSRYWHTAAGGRPPW